MGKKECRLFLDAEILEQGHMTSRQRPKLREGHGCMSFKNVIEGAASSIKFRLVKGIHAVYSYIYKTRCFECYSFVFRFCERVSIGKLILTLQTLVLVSQTAKASEIEQTTDKLETAEKAAANKSNSCIGV
jgi:hypothetical protein